MCVVAHTHTYTHQNLSCQIKETMAVIERRYFKCTNFELQLKIKAIFILRQLLVVTRDQGLTITRTLINH